MSEDLPLDGPTTFIGGRKSVDRSGSYPAGDFHRLMMILKSGGVLATQTRVEYATFIQS